MLKLVEVTWLDAHRDNSNVGHFADEIVKENKAVYLTNIGYVVERTETQMFLADSYEISVHERPGEPMFRDIMIIPVMNIKRVRRLK